MNLPVVEALVARYFVQRGYLVWNELAIDEGHGGDIDVIACNAGELVVAECKDQYTGSPEGLLNQIKRAVGYLKSEACPHATLMAKLKLRQLLVLPRIEYGGDDAWRKLAEMATAEGIEVMDADRVMLEVIRKERELLKRRQGSKGPRGRYGKQPDTIRNLIKWLIYRDWLKV